MDKRCDQCSAPATVRADWMANKTRQSAELCDVCADKLWRQFGRTTHFNFSKPENVGQD